MVVYSSVDGTGRCSKCSEKSMERMEVVGTRREECKQKSKQRKMRQDTGS